MNFVVELLDRLFLFISPKMQISHAQEGIAALRMANSVISQSIARGGELSFPWYYEKAIVDYELLEQELFLLKVRSRDRKLKEYVGKLERCLETIFINATYAPSIVVSGYTEIDPKTREENRLKSQAQQKAYLLVGNSFDAALARIAKLESRNSGK